MKEETVDSQGIKVDSGKDILIRKSRGYVSYVRGDNPYTFPYRILPEIFSPENSILVNGSEYPRQQINGKTILKYKLDNYTRQGFDDYIIAVGYRKNKIVDPK